MWFRRDLRLQDNPALSYALEQGSPVIAVFIYSPDEESPWQPGAASRWWLHHSLESLVTSLKKMGLTLHFFSGDSKSIITQVIKQTQATSITWNNLYEPQSIKRDEHLTSYLKNIEIKRFDSGLFFTPGSLLNKQQQPYRVFTPFWKNARQRLELQATEIVPYKKYKASHSFNEPLKNECKLEALELLDKHPWHEKLQPYWLPGEPAAHVRLETFLDEIIGQYKVQRDFPAIDGTSKLSAHLHFGEITPGQIYYQLLQKDFPVSAQSSLECFLSELGWREFAYHVLWHFPHTSTQAMNGKFKKYWPNKPDKKLLTAWQQGNTGIAIVDAGMKQLWETGWMHNRVRMIVASLLTKNMGIHWMHGARWFWDTLVDADLASNSLGWQWVAGCGVDAAPYYRIFNPDTQAKRFDAKLDYVNHWCPEYSQSLIRQPVVDLSTSREKALKRYQQYK
ncbi:MAG: deoxyribodipyrimidine photo-lyase [Thioalkalispiraceae bacterium]